MATLKVKPSSLKGTLAIPPSKSHTMRALLFGSMGNGKSQIHHYLKSPDTLSMVQALRQLGVEIDLRDETIEILGCDGRLKSPLSVIDAGNSGQVLRFIGSLAALIPSYTVITGDHSIRHNRPIEPLLSAITQLNGSALTTRMGRLIIRGPIEPGFARVEGEDSQPISGLLMATSFLEGKTELEVTNPGEKPWVDLTLSWLKRFKAKVSHHNYGHYWIEGPLRYGGFETQVPGDFSSAAFPMVAAIITQSTLTLENLDMQDNQGDKKIIDLLTHMGARIDQEEKRVTMYPTPSLSGVTIDVNEMIDALPILAVLGCFATSVTEIFNGAIARKKESDRIHATTEELRKMGALIEEEEDGLIINPSSLKGASLSSHGDHRIAMALTVAALGASGESTIEGVECIAKSYPSFISDLQKRGAALEEIK